MIALIRHSRHRRRATRTRALDDACRGPKASVLSVACWALLVLAACGDGSDPGMDTGTDGGPMPPDLGPDAVACGEAGEWRSSDEQLAALAGCDIYEGSLLLSIVYDLSPLSSLRIVRRSITATGSVHLETLDGLHELEWVGSFHFSDTRLRDLAALGNLTGVEDYFELIALADLESLHGLEGLRTVGGGLAGLKEVGGNVTIHLNPQLTPAEIDAFLDRIEVGGVVNLN